MTDYLCEKDCQMTPFDAKIARALRNLCHLYEQMIQPGMVNDQSSAARAARGLLGPAISLIETAMQDRSHSAQ